MKKIIKTYKVYSYDELSENAKDRALQNEHIAYMNVEHDWYESVLENGTTTETLKAAGIELDARDVSFELDRSSYVFFRPFNYETKDKDGKTITKGEHKGIWIEMQSELARALVKDKIVPKSIIKKVENQDVSFGIETSYYAGGVGKNSLSVNADGDAYEYVEKLDHEAIADWLSDKLEDMRIELSKEYDYLTSRESIEETIRANEYEFSEEGTFPAY